MTAERGSMKRALRLKSLVALILCICCVTQGMTVYAAPEVMPDGELFDAEFYAATYPDVAAVFGTDPAMLYWHYVVAGKAEGRLPYAAAQATQPVQQTTSSSPVTNGFAAMVPGSVVTIGRYEQDGNPANGSEPIEWIVLANDGHRLFILSKYILENRAWLHDYANVPWELSDLRVWMNGSFYDTAFTAEEKQCIVEVTNSNQDSGAFFGPGLGLPSGNATNDKVFALSVYEAQAYLGAVPQTVADWNPAMQATTTIYAQQQGCWTHSVNRRGFWWLRSAGACAGSHVAVVQDHGAVVSHVGNAAGEGVRPAMWVAY